MTTTVDLSGERKRIAAWHGVFQGALSRRAVQVSETPNPWFGKLMPMVPAEAISANFGV